MDTVYADDALLQAAGNLEADGDLIAYLTAVGNGDRWIYTESARICVACAAAAKKLTERNQQLALLLAERNHWDEITARIEKNAYRRGLRYRKREIRLQEEQQVAKEGVGNE